MKKPFEEKRKQKRNKTGSEKSHGRLSNEPGKEGKTLCKGLIWRMRENTRKMWESRVVGEPKSSILHVGLGTEFSVRRGKRRGKANEGGTTLTPVSFGAVQEGGKKKGKANKHRLARQALRGVTNEQREN